MVEGLNKVQQLETLLVALLVVEVVLAGVVASGGEACAHRTLMHASSA